METRYLFIVSEVVDAVFAVSGWSQTDNWWFRLALLPITSVIVVIVFSWLGQALLACCARGLKF